MCETQRLPGLLFPVFRSLTEYGQGLQFLKIEPSKSKSGGVSTLCGLDFVKQHGQKVFVDVHFAHLQRLRLATVYLKAQLQIERSGGCLPAGHGQSHLFQIWLQLSPAQELHHQRSTDTFSALFLFDVYTPDASFVSGLLFRRAVEAHHSDDLAANECCQYKVFARNCTESSDK
jgi:hypothetical protein